MNLSLVNYALEDATPIVTPALLIYPEIVASNIRAMLAMVGNQPERLRPHIKTAKLQAVVRAMIDHGILQFKCATTLELLTACRAGARDVLVAFAMTGANARRVMEIAEEYPQTRVSVLVESKAQIGIWNGGRSGGPGVFIDMNPGMNRTGASPERPDAIIELARTTGEAFRGLHWYDGHLSMANVEERKALAYKGYDRLLEIISALAAAGIGVEEVITSGTPTGPFGYSYPGFAHTKFVQRVSPGTVVYNDTHSLDQLPGFGFQPAAVVLTTVISHPLPLHITCDAGHKSVSVDAGVPNCAVVGHPDLKPLKPSEEHLPLEGVSAETLPAIGDKLYLVPRHVCPTVNNFDEALMIVNGRIEGVEKVTARGHENPLALLSCEAVG